MESERERAAPLPTPKRHQVLRPGVRIIGEQFDLEQHPDVVEVTATLGEIFSGMSRRFVTQYGTSVHKMIEALNALDKESKSLGNHTFTIEIDEVSHPERFYGSDHPRLPVKLRNDGKPKKQKQEEPFYVRNEKRKRR